MIICKKYYTLEVYTCILINRIKLIDNPLPIHDYQLDFGKLKHNFSCRKHNLT